MTCPACTAAEQDPRTAQREAGCRSCVARMLAATGAHLESAEAEAMTPRYRDALQQLFGADWMQGHEMVRNWAWRIAQAKARAR